MTSFAGKKIFEIEAPTNNANKGIKYNWLARKNSSLDEISNVIMSPALTPFWSGFLNKLKLENNSERTPVPQAFFEEHELQPTSLLDLIIIES